ncbi:carbamoyltransferase C-terminal domain-containing protein [Sphingomonas sp. DG1-23]|uniref:carbamoyltransferase C-terminal domain-containing protein n=1 Tax=Sphingomonas sp. DG1-23 TaxID=3068316 RepID=UPI00273E0FC2|nr:carbamoyltransferase C-terminal domain-containing protein [Sphingomonas sp. DG1-23]MDP5279861.1 carbamoyltransferase C-terminal domain-containing protein [Sphingomonas sp. DG1-23]
MRILALHTLGHDAGLAWFEHGRLVYSMEAERETRRRFEPYCDAALDALERDTGLTPADADLIAVSTNIRNSLVGIPDLAEVYRRIQQGALAVETTCEVRGSARPCLVVAHEASHAALAAHWLPGGDPALILVNEGRGTFSRNALFYAAGGRMELRRHDLLPWYATGFGWSALGELMGFGSAPGAAGTLMAMGGYGAPDETVMDALRAVPDSVLSAPLGEQREIGAALAQRLGGLDAFAAKARVVASLQKLFTDTIVSVVTDALAGETGARLALGGGCALNIPTNTELRQRLAADVAVPPACNDAGQALGAGIYASRFHFGEGAAPIDVYSNGIAEPEAAIVATAERRGWQVRPYDRDRAADDLAAGGIIAWIDGAAEIGPRALGARSLLGSANHQGMRKRMSEGVKARHWFRPLAPVVREETFERLFPGQASSPHMLHSYRAAALDAPEALHVDGSARIQTLSRHARPELWHLLERYEGIGGGNCLINTSLNGPGRPIAQRLDHALDDLEASEVALVVCNGLALSR